MVLGHSLLGPNLTQGYSEVKKKNNLYNSDVLDQNLINTIDIQFRVMWSLLSCALSLIHTNYNATLTAAYNTGGVHASLWVVD